MFILNLFWYFIIFSFCGWIAEGIITLFSEKKFYNKGFLTLPFCPTYGFCAVILYLLVNPYADQKYITFIASAVILSVILIVIGILTEKLLGFRPWDFSGMRYTITRYITLPYSLFLGMVGVLLIHLIIPVLNTWLVHIPFDVSLMIVIIILVLILLDYAFSLFTVIKLRKRVNRLKEVSDLLDDDVPQEKLDEIKENYNALFKDNHLRRRLASAYPDLRKRTYMKKLSGKLEDVRQENMKEYTMVYENKDEKPFAFGFCFTKLFFLFVIGSFFGTLMETVWAIVVEGHFELRVGMVYGPFIPVYGGGACFLTIVLYKMYKLNDTLIFAISAVVGASFEYFCSWFQETVFGTVSWDYSNTPFNFNGRTNLMYALIWGFLGLVWVRYLYPWISKLIEKIPKRAGAFITTFLVLFMIFNAFMSVTATLRWTQRNEGVTAQNTFEEYLDKHFSDEHMKILFPHMHDPSEKNNNVAGKQPIQPPFDEATTPVTTESTE